MNRDEFYSSLYLAHHGAQWAKANELRKKTGRTALGRTINNIKYRNG